VVAIEAAIAVIRTTRIGSLLFSMAAALGVVSGVLPARKAASALQLIGLLDYPARARVRFDGAEVGSLSDAERTQIRLTSLGFRVCSSPTSRRASCTIRFPGVQCRSAPGGVYPGRCGPARRPASRASGRGSGH
jgi:hypothetical protein